MLVNGKEINFKEGITVTQLLNEINVDKDRVVVEVDMEIVDRNEYDKKMLCTSSKVEVIRFVGGG
ncbi:thiamine biosynthesis protein ThiS [Clostridium sp. DMHC 10]|uniref:sulfur carrier protein ThiS n=1 Tax=Clostridium sp. DMHC 10 TaxID=747377 RepID=UPI00069CF98D|nr:sulfur carrier protein ThiS [Clostridium sp. DMHC 10]KOF56750.1 thiamine biosynthesis protein ThiS [Clostridium sp. DMHC 10]